MKHMPHMHQRPSSHAAEQAVGGVRELDRLIFFSDAVFAIAITLLVLDLRVPPDLVATALPAALAALWPKLLSFLISFVVIGVYCWQVHHQLFRYIVKYDEHLLGMNLLLLGGVVFLPFSVSLLSAYGSQQIVVATYLGNLGVVALLLLTLLGYAIRRNLTDPALTTEQLIVVLSQTLTLPTFCFLAFVLSFVSPYFWLFAVVLLAPIRLVVGRLLMRYFMHRPIKPAAR